MNEMIIRINSGQSDIEVAFKEDFNSPAFKKLDKREFLNIINDFITLYSDEYKKDLFILDDEIIAIDNHHVVIKQSERKRIVTYNDSENILTYRINFPNSIYIIEFNQNRINGIECYSYKEYDGYETKLFEYPMPNELSGNHICIGNADRAIKDRKYIDALEKIIFTPYSHSAFSGINGFSKTKEYFEYLENNEFPYKFLKPLKKALKDILHD